MNERTPQTSSMVRTLEIAIRLALAAAFIVAGALKLLEPGSLAPVIEAFGILPRFLVQPAAFVLPVLEIVIGAGVLIGSKRADLAMAAMLSVFLLVLGYGLWLGLDVDCGCYGPGDPQAEAFSSMRTALARDLLLLAGCVLLLFKHRIHTATGAADGPARQPIKRETC